MPHGLKGPFRFSDQKSNRGGKESGPANLEEVVELLVSG